MYKRQGKELPRTHAQIGNHVSDAEGEHAGLTGTGTGKHQKRPLGSEPVSYTHLRDVMAYLKMVVNPADEMSVKRVINTPRRGIGSTSIQKIEMLAASNRCSFFQACELACAETGMFSAKVRNGLADFVNIVRCGRRMDGELKDVVEAIVELSLIHI